MVLTVQEFKTKYAENKKDDPFFAYFDGDIKVFIDEQLPLPEVQ